MYKFFFKRLLDLLLSIILIIIFFPIMFVIFFFIWWLIGFPIFVQNRPGLNGKIFKFYKFKTLFDSIDNEDEIKRQSKFGIFLRKMGLDELPQLFNILENKMSLVGPRPLLVEYLDKFTDYEKKRHLLKPGITGLAQVNPDESGQKNWKKSLEMDVYYVANVSFLLDLKIMFKTIKIIITKKKQFQDFKKFNE